MSGSDRPARFVPRKGFLRENGLSLFFALLLLLALVGQAWSGSRFYDEMARAEGLQEIGFWRYVTSSSFAVDVAENWQSEFLQFTLYIYATVWLVQRGSSESKKPGDEGRESDKQQLVGRYARSDSPGWASVGGWRTGLYSHSLVTVMGVLFLLSWAAQFVAGRVSFNEDRLRDRLDPLSPLEYLGSPDFWNRTFQNWQSELLAIGTMAVFAIYLRERGSPESKEVGAPHDATSSSD